LPSLGDEEREIRERLRDDLPRFAARCLKIRTKASAIEPLVLNRAQRYVHARLEEQRAATGRVRAILLKARQQGFSTYIGARFYHRVTHQRGARCFIITHEQEATDTLFGMVARYHAHNNPLVKPSTGAANAKELYFDRLDSGYSVGTAGAKAVGRSKTIQLFHGSEVAFWPNAPTHFAGVVQAVPDLPGTEIVLESTANGLGGEFHERWQQAEAGEGDYIPIFVPWFWAEDYQREPGAGFRLEAEEADYAALHGLDLAQMAWRRAKLAELKDPALFLQEYPATAAEAFQAPGHDGFIKAGAVLAARKAQLEGFGPLIGGADPARFGDDRFSLAWRRARVVEEIASRRGLDVVAGAHWIKAEIDARQPRRVFVDVGGVGGGTVDVLRSWGAPYDEVVVPVNFGAEPREPPRTGDDGRPMAGPRNRRAEMWMKSKAWLEDEAGASIPDLDSLQADACAPGYRYDINQRLLLESKEDMRRRGVRSPDEWDAVALTFAEPVGEGSGPRDIVVPAFGAV
jgi:hypothetical protein